MTMCVSVPHGGRGCLTSWKVRTRRERILLVGSGRIWREPRDPSTFAQEDNLGELKMAKKCKHLDQIKITATDKHVCEDCVKIGDTWVHLRMCMSCGKVGCCDSSKNKHATKHFHQTSHPVMRSVEPGEDWIWCYVDEIISGAVAA